MRSGPCGPLVLSAQKLTEWLHALASNGVACPVDVARLEAAGVPRLVIAQMQAAPQVMATVASSRPEVPQSHRGRRANMNKAIAVAAPSQRARALSELDRDILAHTTRGPKAS